MNAIKNILVVVDPTAASQPCIDKAAALAKVCGARIELLACDSRAAQEVRAAEQLAAGPEMAAAALREILEALAKPLRTKGLEVSTTALCIEPLYTAVINHAVLSDSDLVVKDTHHHWLAKRTFLTNTDWHLIRKCPKPLLLTKAKPWHDKPSIVAAVDPGHERGKPVLLDQMLLSWAESLSEHLNGTVHVAHAFLPALLVAGAVNGGTPVWIPTAGELLKTETAQKMAELKLLISDYAISTQNVHLEIGSPRDVLQRVIEHTLGDILVAGAISRSAVKEFFVGSTAERILEHIPCDILVVKPPNFADDLPF